MRASITIVLILMAVTLVNMAGGCDDLSHLEAPCRKDGQNGAYY